MLNFILTAKGVLNVAQIYITPMKRFERDGSRFVVHARRDFHGRARYDFVLVQGTRNNDLGVPEVCYWVARVLALISTTPPADAATRDEEWTETAIIQWLEDVQSRLTPDIRTYRLCKGATAIHPTSFKSPLRLVSSPETDGENGSNLFCAIPFGKSLLFNKLK